MRILSFVLAFAFVLAGPALHVSPSQDRLPGVGTFSYSGSPVTNSVAPRPVMLASR